MARRRKDETPSGFLSVLVTENPRVRLREERVRGSNVIAEFDDPRTGKRAKRTLEYSVRDAKGRIDEDALDRAKEDARDLAAKLRLDRERFLAEPARVTVGGGFGYFHDPVDGALVGASHSYSSSHVRARRFWEGRFGTELPWNQMTPAAIDAAAEMLREEGTPTKAVQFVERLHTVWAWLTNMRDIEGLRDPTRKFSSAKFLAGYTPRRPRFSEDQLFALIGVSRQVDPRFRLLLCFADSSGSRGGQIRTTWRSAWNRPLAVEPEPGDAPFGWIVFGGVKGQADQLVFLTSWQLEELVGAVGGYWSEDEQRIVPGYLSEFERRYQESGRDYPLVPGGYLRKGLAPMHRRNEAPIGRTEPWNWLREAERLADIEHVEGRALHGIRRAWAKWSRREIGKTAAARAGGWTREETMEEIYAGERFEDMAVSREAQERRARDRFGAGNPKPKTPDSVGDL